MERRAGNLIEAYADKSMASATEASFDAEMSDPAILTKPATVLEEQTGSFDSGNHNDYDDDYKVKHQMCMNVQVGPTKSKMRGQGIVVPKKLKFKPLTRKGMSVCADHGWQKKGFDSLTGI